MDPALVFNGALGLSEALGVAPGNELARAALLGGAGALSSDGGDPLVHGLSVGAGAGAGRILGGAAADALASFKAPWLRPILRSGGGALGVLGGRAFAKHHDAGAFDAARALGVEKTAFAGGIGGGVGKWLSRGSKLLGAVPTGWGNVAAGAMGALGEGMNAHAQGKSGMGILAHAGAGALNGIPGGAGMAASMGASAVANSAFKPAAPPPPPQVGQMTGG